jgi:FtsP/CotA-like multicopper oxidase with cupredoxin domain
VAVRGRVRLGLACGATAALVLPLGWLWQASLVPDSYDMAEMGYADWGGGPAGSHAGHHGAAVADLTADPDRSPDVATTLSVREDGGRYTVNGTSPGPVLRATEGDLVEVTLRNENVAEGTTLHWHGIDVPNAADGVAGVTQDAVGAGEEFVYRFVAEQAGTYWYHSHQLSHEQVRRGLLGAVVIEPEQPPPGVVDALALLHLYDGTATVNGEAGTVPLEAEPGDEVRLRVVNTDNGLAPVWVTGADVTVLAVDGTDVHRPGPLRDTTVRVPAGGRVDLGFTVPESGVRVDFAGSTAMVAGPDPTGGAGGVPPSEAVDLLGYGEPADLGFDPTAPDRVFDYRIGRRPGFLDGRPGMWWTVNGGLFPDVPMYMVAEGDVVVFRIENSSGETHPMHLHGHHAVVLSRDGEPASGSPWWVDSLEVGAGQTFEVAFVADNPGLWMDHCHNLPHAADGLVAHLMYEGVTSSYRIGGDAHNEPE